MIDINELWLTAQRRGDLSKMRVARYLCDQGCTLADVIRIGDLVLAQTKDHKVRPRTNEHRSVAEARVKNTIDGERHWPGRVYDVEILGRDPRGRFDANCRHGLHLINARELLTTIENVAPGHPGKPILL